MLMMNSEALERLERHMECLVGKIMEELKGIKEDICELKKSRTVTRKVASRK